MFVEDLTRETAEDTKVTFKAQKGSYNTMTQTKND